MQNQELIHHTSVQGDIKEIAKEIAKETCHEIQEELEHLDIDLNKLNTDVEQIAVRILNHISTQEDRIAIYEEAIPGFTLLAIKKSKSIENTGNPKIAVKPQDQTDLEYCSIMFDQYLKNSDKSIISIDHPSILILLFASCDLRKHLKSFGIIE